MKQLKSLMKLLGVLVTVAAAACAIIAYWDKVEELFFRLRDKVSAYKVTTSNEVSDFADWDE